MPEMTIRPFRPAHNADIINAIRNDATPDFQRRIPAATKASVQDTVAAMMDYRPAMNEFINALVNRIGLVIARNQSWTNPLAKYKRGLLTFGDTIEEIQLGLAEAKIYDPNREYLERDIFGLERPEAQSSFHKVNRQNFYKISINEAELRKAFLSPEGLSSFITQLMQSPVTSDNWDEFLLTTSLFAEYERNGGFFKVQVPDISSDAAGGDEARIALKRFRAYADKLTFLSRHYNAAGMPIAADRDELELILTPEANANIDVEGLAAAFNIERSAIPSRTTVVPQEYFGIPGAQALLTTKDFFVIADSRFETTEAVNPVGLHTNFFLHHWQVISASRFVPAILFTTQPGDVITLTPTPVTDVAPITITDADGDTVTEVIRGEMFQLNTSAVTTPTGGENDAVRFTLTGNKSLRTYLSQTGVLHVAIDEAAESLTFKAVATDNEAQTETRTVPVNGVKAVIWPDPAVTTDSQPGV